MASANNCAGVVRQPPNFASTSSDVSFYGPPSVRMAPNLSIDICGSSSRHDDSDRSVVAAKTSPPTPAKTSSPTPAKTSPPTPAVAANPAENVASQMPLTVEHVNRLNQMNNANANAETAQNGSDYERNRQFSMSSSGVSSAGRNSGSPDICENEPQEEEPQQPHRYSYYTEQGECSSSANGRDSQMPASRRGSVVADNCRLNVRSPPPPLIPRDNLAVGHGRRICDNAYMFLLDEVTDCREHMRQCTFFCDDCCMEVCPDCTESFHKTHLNVRCPSGQDIYKKTIKSHEQVRSLISSMRRTKDHLVMAKMNAAHQIRNTFAQLRETMTVRERQLVEELESKVHYRQVILFEKYKEYRDLLNAGEHVVTGILDCCSRRDTERLPRYYYQAKAHLDRTEGAVRCAFPLPEEHVSFQAPERFVIDAINSIGGVLVEPRYNLDGIAISEYPILKNGNAAAAVNEFANFRNGNAAAAVNEYPNFRSGNAAAAVYEYPNFRNGNAAASVNEYPNFGNGNAAAAVNEYPNFGNGNAAAAVNEYPNFGNGNAAAAVNEYPNFGNGNAAAAVNEYPNFGNGNAAAAVNEYPNFRNENSAAAVNEYPNFRNGNAAASVNEHPNFRNGNAAASVNEYPNFRNGNAAASVNEYPNFRNGNAAASVNEYPNFRNGNAAASVNEYPNFRNGNAAASVNEYPNFRNGNAAAAVNEYPNFRNGNAAASVNECPNFRNGNAAAAVNEYPNFRNGNAAASVNEYPNFRNGNAAAAVNEYPNFRNGNAAAAVNEYPNFSNGNGYVNEYTNFNNAYDSPLADNGLTFLNNLNNLLSGSSIKNSASTSSLTSMPPPGFAGPSSWSGLSPTRNTDAYKSQMLPCIGNPIINSVPNSPRVPRPPFPCSQFQMSVDTSRQYNRIRRPILVVGAEGSGPTDLCRPWGVCCDGNHIVVADRSNNRIQVYRTDGTHLRSFGSHGDGNGEFNRPAGVAIDILTNRIVVADKDNHRIQVFTMEGVFKFSFGTRGSNNGQFHYPWDVAVNKKGMIVVTDTRNHRVQLFRSNGKFEKKFGYENAPTMWKYFDSPRGVCFTEEDTVLVTDFNNHRIFEIDFSGQPRFVNIDNYRRCDLYRPQGVDVDLEGNILVADCRNNRIQVFKRNGEPKGSFGYPGKELGQFDRPSGIGLTPDGKIAVVDFGNHRVQVF